MAAKKKVAKKAAKKSAKKAAVTATKKKTGSKAGKKKAAKKVAAKKVAAKQVAKKAAKKAPKNNTASKAAAKKTAKNNTASKAAAKKVAKAKVAEVPPPAPKKKVVRKQVKMTLFIKKQEKRLLDLRDELMDAMYGVQQETILNAPSGSEASGSGMHQGDAGSDAYDRDFALNLLSKEQDALQEIEAALERIAAGYYGICEISGKRIPQARLEAIPFARLTVECQSLWEKEHPNRKFRSIDAIGFVAANGTPAVSLDPAVD